MENMVELVPHRPGRALPFSLNTIKKPHNPFPKIDRINSKNVIQEKLFTLKKAF